MSVDSSTEPVTQIPEWHTDREAVASHVRAAWVWAAMTLLVVGTFFAVVTVVRPIATTPSEIAASAIVTGFLVVVAAAFMIIGLSHLGKRRKLMDTTWQLRDGKLVTIRPDNKLSTLPVDRITELYLEETTTRHVGHIDVVWGTIIIEKNNGKKVKLEGVRHVVSMHDALRDAM